MRVTRSRAPSARARQPDEVLQSRRLEVVPDCPLQAELAAFDFAISARGHATFDAQSGSHDDLVMALTLAVWFGERPDATAAWIEATRRRLARHGVRAVGGGDGVRRGDGSK